MWTNNKVSFKNILGTIWFLNFEWIVGECWKYHQLKTTLWFKKNSISDGLLAHTSHCVILSSSDECAYKIFPKCSTAAIKFSSFQNTPGSHLTIHVHIQNLLNLSPIVSYMTHFSVCCLPLYTLPFFTSLSVLSSSERLWTLQQLKFWATHLYAIHAKPIYVNENTGYTVVPWKTNNL